MFLQLHQLFIIYFKTAIVSCCFISGFMSELELEMFQAVPNLEFNTYWIPCTWFIALLKDTKKSNRITDSQGLQTIIQVF